MGSMFEGKDALADDKFSKDSGMGDVGAKMEKHGDN